MEETFSGGGNGVKQIKKFTEILGGTVTWNPVNNDEGEKIGTELRIKIYV